jgi:hypothetical protein
LFYPFVDAWEPNFDSDEFFSFLHALVALMNQVNYFFLHWSRDAQFLIFMSTLPSSITASWSRHF